MKKYGNNHIWGFEVQPNQKTFEFSLLDFVYWCLTLTVCARKKHRPTSALHSAAKWVEKNISFSHEPCTAHMDRTLAYQEV
jgi:hypothetical protein